MRHAVPRALLLLLLASLVAACKNGGDDDSDAFCSGPNETLEANDSLPEDLTVVDGKLLFRAVTPDDEWAVWVWDGRGEPEVVRDLVDAGVRPSLIRDSVAFDGALYFVGVQDETGTELWKTDGVRSELVVELQPGAASGYPRELTVFDDHVYFTGSDGVVGFELWRVDADGDLELAFDFFPGSASCAPSLRGASDELLLLNVDDDPDDLACGRDFWEYDGIDARFVSDRAVGGSVVFDGLLHFRFEDDDGPGLFRYDAVDPPEKVIEGDVRTLLVGDELYYTQWDTSVPGNARSVWSWDGVRSRMIYGAEPREIVTLVAFYQGALHFGVNGSGFDGDLFRARGFAAPERVASWDILSLDGAVVFDGELVYRGHDDRHGYELWAFDGADDRRLFDLFPGRFCRFDDPDDQD